MPARLTEAFESPYHSYGKNDSVDTSSLRNPSNQKDYQLNLNLTDIVSEADDIKSVYNTVPTFAPAPTAASASSSSNSTDNDHNCNLLVARVLSCPVCRKRLGELFKDDDSSSNAHGHAHAHAQEQSGGGIGMSKLFDDNFKNLLLNIFYGLVIIFALDMLRK